MKMSDKISNSMIKEFLNGNDMLTLAKGDKSFMNMTGMTY